MLVRKHKSDRIIGVITVILLAVGLIVIYAIGPMRANVMNAAYGTDYSENYFFWRQLLSVSLALIVFVVAFSFPYRTALRLGKVALLAGLGLCILLAVLSWFGSSLAQCSLGACRWFNLGFLSLQPAEILKFGLVLYLAGLMSERKKEGKLESWTDFWLPFTVVCGLSLLLVVVVQKDLGTGAGMMAIILAMLFMSGVKMRYFLMTLGVIGAVGVISIVAFPHRMERILTFGAEDSSDAYHSEHALSAIGTGGRVGVGVGNRVQATGSLPESINDSVFAVMGETFGFVGLVAVVGCFTLLLLRLLRTARYLPDDRESLVVVGIFAWATAHVVINIASMTGLIPLTGITLPLLSYGGTSMLLMAAALGLALQLSCYTAREPRREATTKVVKGTRRGSNRSVTDWQATEGREV